ncbi:MAG: molybdate ABC transporter substrate-binding protein [Chloroflexota bacterium]
MPSRLRVAALVFTCLAACGSSPTSNIQTQTLTVFAAASLLDAFTEIGKSFETVPPGVTVIFNFDGSQSLRTQIEQGAIADVVASAHQNEMDALITQSLIFEDPRSGAEGANNQSQTFITNQLIVILPPQNPANIQSLADLAHPGILLVLASEDVPVGAYSRETLEKLNTQFGADYKDKVLANVVSSEDNVKQIVAKVQLGEADAGIVYASDAVAAPDLRTVAIPPDYNAVAEYPIAVLAAAPHPDLAAEFVAYVISAEGQSILKKWGFTPALPSP